MPKIKKWQLYVCDVFSATEPLTFLLDRFYFFKSSPKTTSKALYISVMMTKVSGALKEQEDSSPNPRPMWALGQFPRLFSFRNALRMKTSTWIEIERLFKVFKGFFPVVSNYIREQWEKTKGKFLRKTWSLPSQLISVTDHKTNVIIDTNYVPRLQCWFQDTNLFNARAVVRFIFKICSAGLGAFRIP